MTDERADAEDGRASGWERLARSWPRELLRHGAGDRLARWWCAAVAPDGVGAPKTTTRGERSAMVPPVARCNASPALLERLSEARRSRRLVRGLEEAAARLGVEEEGLRQADATRPPGGARISRLLVVSADGSPRFYRQLDRVLEAHAGRVAALVLGCDETVLGEATFGRGRRARAVLLDHKQAVADFLSTLAEQVAPEASGVDTR